MASFRHIAFEAPACVLLQAACVPTFNGTTSHLPTWGQPYSSVRPAPWSRSSALGATVPCGCVDALPHALQGGLLTQWKKSRLNHASSSWARAVRAWEAGRQRGGGCSQPGQVAEACRANWCGNKGILFMHPPAQQARTVLLSQWRLLAHGTAHTGGLLCSRCQAIQRDD